jgi:hypothetical protein
MPQQSTVASKKIDAKSHKISKKSLTQSGKNRGNGEDRYQMISDAAYYRALGRGFDGGDPVEDWLMAEAEIESMPHNWEEPDNQSSFD